MKHALRTALPVIAGAIALGVGQDSAHKTTTEPRLPGFVERTYSREFDGGWRGSASIYIGAPVRMAVEAEGIPVGALVRPLAYRFDIMRGRVSPTSMFGLNYLRDGSQEPLSLSGNFTDFDEATPTVQREYWSSIEVIPKPEGGWMSVAKPDDIEIVFDVHPREAK